MNILDGFPFRPMPVFEGEGGGAPGGDPAGGGAPAAWTPPEGLDAQYVGADANETLGKILPAFSEATTRADGLRAELAKRPGAPKTADDYDFKPDEKIAPFFGDVAANPALKIARETAHKLGLSNDQFGGLVNGVYSQMAEAGMLLPPLDQASELTSYMKLAGVDKAGAEADFKSVESFVKGLLSQLKLPDDAETRASIEGYLMSATDFAGGNLFLKSLMARLQDSGIHIAGDASNAGGEVFAKDELRKLASDPRNDPKNPKYDRDFAEKLSKSYQHWAQNG